MRPLFSLFLLMVIWGGCTLPEKVSLKPKQDLPLSFGEPGITDSSNLQWQYVFRDSLLKQLLQEAVNNNLDLQLALRRMGISEAKLVQKRGALFPQVQGQLSTGAERYGDYTLNGVGNFDTNLSPNISNEQRIPVPLTPDHYLGLRASWEIDIWGKLRSRKKAALYQWMASAEAKKLIQTQLIAEIAGLYYQLVCRDAELSILNKNIKLQETALGIVQLQKSSGKATALAENQFEAQLLHTRARSLEIQQEIIRTEYRLNYLLGRYPQAIKRAPLQKLLQDTGRLKAGIPSQLLLNRPDIREAYLELQAANAEISAERAAFFPSLIIQPHFGLHSFSAAHLFGASSLAYGLAGGLSAPLLNRQELKANYRHSLARGETRLLRFRQLVLQGFGEVSQALNIAELLQQRLDLQEQQVTALTNAVNNANQLYLSGYANYLEVITAQRSVVAAELEWVATQQELFLNEVFLYRSLGGGWQ